MADLYIPLSDHDITLAPLDPSHRDGLAAACAADADIWAIYPFSYDADHFDESFARMLSGGPGRLCYAIMQGGSIVGMTAWIDNRPDFQSVEIGNSYIIPALRGSGFNDRLKRLMIDHAVRIGYRRIVFKVDARNQRSQGAVLKLGCTKEGVLRAERITWNGHLRDTAIFSILADEWRAQRGEVA